VSPETQAFLDQVRDAEDPSPEVEERVLLALNATLAAGAVGAGAWSASKAVKLLAGGGVSAWKLGTLGLCVLAATSALVWPRESADPPRPVPVVHAPPRPELQPQPAPAPAPAPASLPTATALEPARIRAVPASASAAASAPAPSLRGELSLLSLVQAALQRSDGGEALRLLDEHHTSDRQLAAERAAARVFALCAAGRDEEARNAAAAFARDYPSSIQTSAVARACGSKEQQP
jgi:hypothetical protein